MEAMGNYKDASEASEDDWAAEVETRTIVVDQVSHGQRLDKVLSMGVPEFSRSYLQKLIVEDRVSVGSTFGTKAVHTPSTKVLAGQHIHVQMVPTAETLAFRAEPLALDVVFADEHLLIINKPSGLVVHPGSGNWSGTLLNGLLYRFPDAAGLARAGIVHRLDKDTSGLMVVGRTLQSVTQLSRDIAARRVHREYLALAHGTVEVDQTIDAPVGRDLRSRTRMAVVSSGKAAKTDVFVMAGLKSVTAVRCVLHSGRTHQIRVHMTHIGHPLVGDSIYGGKPILGMTRQALHAYKLELTHPIDQRPLSFCQPPPADFGQAWTEIGTSCW